MKYERLTEKDNKGRWCVKQTRKVDYATVYNCEGSYIIGTPIDRLAQLEDKIESGQAVILPCKVGDTVYIVEDEIFEWEVVSIEIFDFDTVLRLGHKGSLDYAAEYVSSLGERLFITCEEAEKKLKELRGGV